jgi:hypothetical protein
MGQRTFAGVLGWLRSIAGRPSDRLLFLTHTPDAFSVGTAYEGNRVTRLKKTTSTELADGGVVTCWEVYGEPENASCRA